MLVRLHTTCYCCAFFYSCQNPRPDCLGGSSHRQSSLRASHQIDALCTVKSVNLFNVYFIVQEVRQFVCKGVGVDDRVLCVIGWPTAQQLRSHLGPSVASGQVGAHDEVGVDARHLKQCLTHTLNLRARTYAHKHGIYMTSSIGPCTNNSNSNSNICHANEDAEEKQRGCGVANLSPIKESAFHPLPGYTRANLVKHL